MLRSRDSRGIIVSAIFLLNKSVEMGVYSLKNVVLRAVLWRFIL